MILDFDALRDIPASVRIYHDDTPAGVIARRNGTDWQAGAVTVSVRPGPAGTEVRVHAPHSEISRVSIRWPMRFTDNTLFLGDAWERGYGDLQWRFMQPDRVLPWYFAAHNPTTATTITAGVKTGPATLCFWLTDPNGITLWLDLRNGAFPCIPGDRIIEAATVVTASSTPGETPMATLRRFCKLMCDKPRPITAPVCGSNNWYYAYGKFDAKQAKRDAVLLSELAGDHSNRPYCILDAGWTGGGGPWTQGWPNAFPDMPGLAQEMINIGVRPGIWIRPTGLIQIPDRKVLRMGPQKSPEQALDITLAENLELMREDMHRMHTWGYQLIKHDFSTYDSLSRWGFEMGGDITDPDWHFADRSLTNAEILLRLYRTLREGAGDAVLIGCNTIGHLGAGLFELQRTGDDTSGKLWERSRKMGINTVAFRMPQHGTFFSADPDCVAHTEHTDWEKDRQFLDLVARSGQSLFVSVDPTKITSEVKNAMSSAMQLALSGGAKEVEPLDWLTNTAPQKWRFDGELRTYDWNENNGAWPFKC